MASDLAQVFLGQCRLQVDSTTQISLQRYMGRYINLVVASALIARLIPASGPTLTVAGAGLSASTLYYLYAFDNAGTLTLEASATGHVTDSTFGIEIKSGDSTRALVGMVYVDAASHFVDSTVARHLANWFNRAKADLVGTFSADRSTASTTFAEVNSEIQISFLTWADEAFLGGITGTTSTDAGGNAVATAIAIDSTTVATQANSMTGNAATRFPISLWVSKRLSEGRHFATLLGGVSGGNGTWVTADNVSIGAMKTRLWGETRI